MIMLHLIEDRNVPKGALLQDIEHLPKWDSIKLSRLPRKDDVIETDTYIFTVWSVWFRTRAAYQVMNAEEDYFLTGYLFKKDQPL